uniref:Uncharacterized protein n=1 Tax=Denticeps clupeoides TaxID=299321 RepID=A0AAY4DQX2_9TELE
MERLVFCLGAAALLRLLLKWSWRAWCGFRVHVLSRFLQVDLRTYGRWAVVTGATSGIGRAYANELARRGMDIVLISRSAEKLRQVAGDIESRFGRKTRVIQTDFTEGPSIYAAIEGGLQGLDIGILVNNVGMNYSELLSRFLDIPSPDCANHDPGVVPPQMTRLVLPRMIERRKGLVINISSEAGSQPQPMLAMYSATKIFVTYFSRCLDAEYRLRGITVQCVAPFMVFTNMTRHLGVNPLAKRAPEFAWEALNTVGHATFTSGCMSHALQVRHTLTKPTYIVDIMNGIMSMQANRTLTHLHHECNGVSQYKTM